MHKQTHKHTHTQTHNLTFASTDHEVAMLWCDITEGKVNDWPSVAWTADGRLTRRERHIDEPEVELKKKRILID